MPKNILVVDDNEDNRIALEILLERFADLKIFSAQNGQEAVELCQKEPMDIVFMDIMMPEMDGIEATKKIREFDRSTMIVAVSALGDEESQKKMILYGAEDYIVKPIIQDVFKRRLQNYLEIIASRKKRHFDQKARNLFTKRVFNRSLVFRINHPTGLSEFWEYYLLDSPKSSEEIHACVRLLYAFGRFILKSGALAEIISEEDHSHLYLSLTSIDKLNRSSLQRVILKKYPEAQFILSSSMLTFKLPKTLTSLTCAPLLKNKEESYEMCILRKRHVDCMDAKTYVENTPFSLLNAVDMLEDNEDAIDKAISRFENFPTLGNLHAIGGLFAGHAEVLEQLLEFEHLAFGVRSLSTLLATLDDTKLSLVAPKILSVILTTILEDLTQWRRNIFLDKNARDIHYLDSSLFSSCLQAQALFEEKSPSQEEDDNDLELF